MALPQLNDIPKYEVIIPSIATTVTYRPFLVAEQKVLLMALETQDEKSILNAIVDTIKACIEDPIDIKTLSTFDIEYLFTQIRSKSVGETTTLMLKCSNCEHDNKVTIALDQIKVDINQDDRKIKLNDQYTIIMKYPSFVEALNNDNISDNNIVDSLYEMVVMSLDKLMTEEDIISFKDESKESIDTFLNSLTAKQFEPIMAFVNNLPALRHMVEYTCEQCDHDNKIQLEGVQDFF